MPHYVMGYLTWNEIWREIECGNVQCFFLSPVQETSELTVDYNQDLLDSRKLKYIEFYCTQIDYSQQESISVCKLFYAVQSLRT